MATNALTMSEMYPWPRDLTPACQGHEDPDLWFPFTEGELTRARIVCQSCPIQLLCLEVAVERKDSGVWGGVHLRNGKVAPLQSTTHPDKLRKERMAAKAAERAAASA